MKKRTQFFLFALCPLIPLSSRFAYGLVISIALFWLYFFAILMRKLVKPFVPEKVRFWIELACLGFITTLFITILKAIYPVLVISCEFYIYLAIFSCMLQGIGDSLASYPQTVFPLIPFILAFSAVRELFGFGGLSFPSYTGFIEIPILPQFPYYSVRFWGTTGGALILLGGICWFCNYLGHKLSLSEGKF